MWTSRRCSPPTCWTWAPCPPPGVAWVTVDEGADAGIVISASHNPFEHNGIKIFNGQGFKLSDELEGKIEEILLNDIAVPSRLAGRSAG